MANPLKTLRKLKGRSLKEIRTRGEQAFAARREQIGLGGKLPDDKEFAALLDESRFGGRDLSPENLFNEFYEQGKKTFFQSFADREKTLTEFRRKFGGSGVTASILEKAERLVEGRFDLLGFQDLDFGAAVDWHLEPISQTRAPIKHWKQFDELATDETGDKKIVWELNRHQHFFRLGGAFWLTGDERYAATFVRHLDSWMEQNPPGFGVNWVSSLEVALRAVSWIWAFHFFKDAQSLSPALFHKALKFLYLHGRHIEKYLSTYYSPNTHLTGEALGLYYLGTQLRLFTRSEQWRKSGEKILLSELNRQILNDGVYFEQSTWYQRYTTDFYTNFLILKSLQSDDKKIPEKLTVNLQKQLDFLMYITRPDGTTPLIGDDDGGRYLPLSEARATDFRSVLANGAILFGRGDYKFVAKEISEEMLWLFGVEGINSFENLSAVAPEKTSVSFPAGGYYIMRDGWTATDNYLLIDGGNMGALAGGHSHADSLMIDCAAGGRTFLTDAGTYTYHKSAELRNYFRSTIAHNTLSINDKNSSEPGGKFNWQTMAKTRVNSWIAEDRFDFFEGSHDGYERFPHSPAVHQRSILFLKNDYWIVRDFVATAGANDYQLNFHFDSDAKLQIEAAANGGSCVGEMPEKKAGLRLFTFGDNGGWQRAEGWISSCYGNRVNAPFLRFTANGIGAQEFFTFILPVDSQMTAPEVFETEVGGGRAFVVEYRDYRDLLIFGDGARIVRTEFFDTDFRFFWARLSTDESLPEEFVMTHGSKFNLDGREIINFSQKLAFAAARRLGSRLNVRTSETIFSLSLSQYRSNTRILKNLE